MAADLDQARLVEILKHKKHAGLAALCRALIAQQEEQPPRHSEDLSSCSPVSLLVGAFLESSDGRLLEDVSVSTAPCTVTSAISSSISSSHPHPRTNQDQNQQCLSVDAYTGVPHYLSLSEAWWSLRTFPLLVGSTSLLAASSSRFSSLNFPVLLPRALVELVRAACEEGSMKDGTQIATENVTKIWCPPPRAQLPYVLPFSKQQQGWHALPIPPSSSSSSPSSSSSSSSSSPLHPFICALMWADKTTAISKKQEKGQQHKQQENQERSFSTFRDDIASLLAAQPDPHPLLHALGMIWEREQRLDNKKDDGNGRNSKDREVDEVGSSGNDGSNERKALRAALLADPACPRAMQALQAEVRRAETAEE